MKSPRDQAIEVGKLMLVTPVFTPRYKVLTKRFTRLVSAIDTVEELNEIEKEILGKAGELDG